MSDSDGAQTLAKVHARLWLNNWNAAFASEANSIMSDHSHRGARGGIVGGAVSAAGSRLWGESVRVGFAELERLLERTQRDSSSVWNELAMALPAALKEIAQQVTNSIASTAAHASQAGVHSERERQMYLATAAQAHANVLSTLQLRIEGRKTLAQEKNQNDQSFESPKDKRNVMVVYGRHALANEIIFSFLRNLGLQPLEWSEGVRATGSGLPSVADVVSALFSEAQAVVVVLTPDDEARTIRPMDRDPPFERVLTGQPRPNVLFEAGMALASHPTRTVVVEIGENRPFTDLGGKVFIRLDSPTARQDIAGRLKTAGCDFNLDAKTDWVHKPDFAPLFRDLAEEKARRVNVMSKLKRFIGYT